MSEIIRIEHKSRLAGDWAQEPLLEGEILTEEEARALEIRREPAPETIVDRFLLAQDISQASKITYRAELKQFLAWLREEGLSLLSIQREEILAFKDSLREAGKSSYTVSGYIVAIRRLYAWLESERIYPNITGGIKGAKSPTGFRKDALSGEQVRTVLDSIDQAGLEGQRDYALVNLLARTALRTIEIRRALVEDMRRIDGHAVLYVQGKGRDAKDQFVILTPQAEEPLRDYLKARRAGQEEPLFISHSNRNYGESLTTRSLSRIVKERFRAVGLDDSRLSAHSLRHTAITLARKSGASLEGSQAMARHSSITTTQLYDQALDRIRDGAEFFVDF